MQGPERNSVPEPASLVTQAQQGCRASFGRLVELYWPTAVAMAMARIHDPVEAEDIAQDSFLIAYSRLGELRDPSRFVGWLASIVATRTLTQLRRARVRKTEPLADPWRADPVDASREERIDAGQRARILSIVGRLPAHYQQVIAMRFVAGLSAPEIARQLGKRPGTVRMWLSRAYEKLRPGLKDLAREVMQR